MYSPLCNKCPLLLPFLDALALQKGKQNVNYRRTDTEDPLCFLLLKNQPAPRPPHRPIMDDRTDPDDLHTILSEQRRDLMAAKTLDSDLDMAFKLQMQEAMAASLALKPLFASSSSSRNSPPPSPPHDAILDLAATLMLEDVERFAQEWEDHERTVSEMMKTKEDLNRRIHDQKFAADLRDVPDDYWAKHGDYYERPYCADESSSSSSTKAAAVETENLRLYCKGLVSEERVRDMKVVVAGAGVAICDPRDNLIFEARKNLEAVADGVVLSNEAAELEAIIEGLNKALTLDLKSVTFYCDDYMLYQYVSFSIKHSLLLVFFYLFSNSLFNWVGVCVYVNGSRVDC